MHHPFSYERNMWNEFDKGDQQQYHDTCYMDKIFNKCNQYWFTNDWHGLTNTGRRKKEKSGGMIIYI